MINQKEKIYKFRKLTCKLDYCRLREIIETGNFWCSNFWELNDPMEGVFSTSDIDKIDKIFNGKSEYKICSFSGEEGFQHPAMWGYYAGGFKGVAIEIETDLKSDQCDEAGGVKKIEAYNNQLPDDFDIEKILLNKGEKWKHENEFRFLIKSENNNHSIGKMTAIYFGDPYGNIINKQKVREKSENFKQYEMFKEKIIKIANAKKISYSNVEVKEGKVKIKNDN